MGLVDYASDSDSGSSDAETSTSAATKYSPPPQPSSQSHPPKKPFQKVVDRANPGKIVVSLPQTASSPSSSAPNGDEPPAKRARTTGAGLFSGFNSFLPAPKNTGKQVVKASSTTAPSRPVVNLKTSAAPGFSRDGDEDADGVSASDHASCSMILPPPRRQEPTPSIPVSQKPADEVRLVGKPLMFRPLSVGMNSKKKKKTTNKSNAPPETSQSATNGMSASTTASTSSASAGAGAGAQGASEPPKTKVSLFSMHTDEPSDPTPLSSSHGAYEPLFETTYQSDPSAGYSPYPAQDVPVSGAAGDAQSLDHIADDLNLSAAARRELFGRDGSSYAAKNVVNFNMDREYQHNEDVRAAGDQQVHNPVRALHGGKHSLQQLVQNVQNQKDALEDSFAKGRNNRKEASSRYGW
ncbi:hypothetical protein QQS21_006688 [Conoideocrella luteorostrata]|uniref:Stress activated map kinase interacting n=1 Tax=Conoideocrella luteorostrata TaxID=1105319 RepID=A0AAJ0CMX6_9HYPO|nr:hypothetical protein QQS21_006688 [Conoideocrella luteorostrata]